MTRIVSTLPPRPAPFARTMDPRFLTGVANHPDVRPWLGGDGPIDLTSVITDPANIAVVTDAGGFVAVAHGCGRYEIHSLFLPEGRGRAAIVAMRAGLDYLFTATDAIELVTKVPHSNKAAAGLAQLAGFQALFTSVVPWAAGATLPVTFLSLTLEQWAVRSTALPAIGHWLHEQMEVAKTAFSSTLRPHSDDDAMHDRMAGAAVLMIRAGNARKAEHVYNRWALLTGFPGVRLLRDAPVLMDVGGMVIEARGDEMEVVACQ